MRILAVHDGAWPSPLAGELKGRFPEAELVEMPFGARSLLEVAALRPDIVVLHPRSPDGDGLKLCSQLKGDAATREIPLVLVVPARSPAAMRANALEAGADSLIEEPVDPVELASLASAMFRWRDDRYRALVDQAEEGFLVHDSRGKIRDANRRACETLGYSREELLSLNLADVQDRFRLEGAQSAWERIRPGQPATRLDQFLRKDGTRFPVEVRLGRLDLGGEALFLALVRDVEGRREAEKALTETERTFSAIFRSSPIASLLTSIPEATVLDANESFVRETGYLMEEMAGRSVAEVGLFASIEELSAVRADMNQDRKVYAREIRLRNKSGVIRTCLLSIVEILIGGRRCRLSSILDISDRKESEKALQESEARFRAAFEDVNLSICVLGLDGRFLQVNDATCRLFGYVRDELERMRVADVTHPDDIGISPTFMERAISGHSGHAAFVKRYVRRDGEVVWGQVSSSLVRAADGRPLCFISHLQDVTELQQAREDLELLSADLDRRVRERTAELESANRELESFSYSVSHDLRAPLRAIDGFSKRLADRFGPLLDEEGARLFGVIRTNSQRMAELIDDLLAFSRTSRGEIRRTVVNSSALARSAFLEVTPDAAVRDRIAFTVGELPDAWGDVKLLRQVWVNLLSNAVKFSARSEAPRIEVTGTVEEGQTAFHVRDNGVGFDMAYASKLFGVFQRLHGMNEFEGTGVGLALVHRIVSRHGGGVRAEAALGEGARFSFTLPVGVERAPARLSGEFRTFRG